MKWLYIVIAMIAGSAMAFQGTMNAMLGKVIGLWGSTLVVHITGLLIVIAAMLFTASSFSGLQRWSQAPWYLYLGGLLNVLIIYFVVKAVPKAGVGNATTGIIFAQILTAVIIDHFGIFGVQKVPFNWLDIIGIVLLASGTWLLLKNG